MAFPRRFDFIEGEENNVTRKSAGTSIWEVHALIGYSRSDVWVNLHISEVLKNCKGGGDNLSLVFWLLSPLYQTKESGVSKKFTFETPPASDE